MLGGGGGGVVFHKENIGSIFIFNWSGHAEITKDTHCVELQNQWKYFLSIKAIAHLYAGKDESFLVSLHLSLLEFITGRDHRTEIVNKYCTNKYCNKNDEHFENNHKMKYWWML